MAWHVRHTIHHVLTYHDMTLNNFVGQGQQVASYPSMHRSKCGLQLWLSFFEVGILEETRQEQTIGLNEGWLEHAIATITKTFLVVWSGPVKANDNIGQQRTFTYEQSKQRSASDLKCQNRNCPKRRYVRKLLPHVLNELSYKPYSRMPPHSMHESKS